ncbi:AlpA family phage regulatory protein [Citrobacter freundii]|nr:AlpA family phage regulatory protein [Citrobacter freundii]MBY5089804.1 AlpA family phage regulatory protein [Citrobacter freundii]NTZ34317.1 AlpA family phage regulatory protein [Citrobacter freundii]
MNIYLMDLKQVCCAVGFKKTTIYKWMNAGEFPKSINIGGNVRWASTEVEKWIEEKISKSRVNQQ